MSKRPAAAGDAPSKQAKVATSEPGLPNLLPPHWKNEIARYLEVDMPKWDVGGFVVGDAPHHAMLLGKAPGVLAGVPFATHAIELAGCEVEWLVPEGHVISAEDAKAKRPVAKVTGPTAPVATMWTGYAKSKAGPTAAAPTAPAAPADAS